ncbi:MAG: FecR domain-containing protein [Nitrobacter sp.]
MSRMGALRIAIMAAALALGGSIALAQQVGTASAVNPAATANLKTITIGQSIAHKERIQTKASGSVQLLFLDKTSMTIGPNSDLTIDEYVYDPSANTGKLAATLGKGALRFVGGQISHNGDAEIKTASALIGIRGGVMMTDGKGGIYSGYGTATITSGGQTVTLGAGEFTQTQPGGPPTPPGLPPPGFVQQQIAVFQSAVGQSGGARAGAASQQNVAAAEHNATGSPGGSVTGSGAPPLPTPPTIVGQINAIATAFTQSIQTSNQATALQQVAQDQPTGNNNPPADDNNQPPVDDNPPPANEQPHHHYNHHHHNHHHSSFRRWGFWPTNSSTINTRTRTFREAILGARVPRISDVPTTGSATYTGHVIATVNSAGLVAGGFSNTVDFGARTGAVSVTNLDSTNYTGNVSLNGSSLSTLSHPLTGDVGNRSMTLQGSFFQGKNSPVGEMGGSVAISGTGGYLGSGIFAAAKH